MSDIGDRKWRAWLYMLPNGGGWAALVAKSLDPDNALTVRAASERVTCAMLRRAKGGGVATVRRIKDAMSSAGLALRCCSEGRCNVIKPDDYPAGYQPGDIAEQAMHQALGGR